MKTFVVLLLSVFVIPLMAAGQKEATLPYKGGAIQFEKEVLTSLIIETKDSGRVYFIEVSYSKEKKEVEFAFHGAIENDITTMLVRSFFRDNAKKWDKAYLKKTNVLIPLFISPEDIAHPNVLMSTNLNSYAEAISKSFISKRCYLFKPVFKFRQETQIDIEPNWQ